MHYEASSLPFPSVTLCPNDRVDWKRALELEPKILPNDIDKASLETYRKILGRLSMMSFGDFDDLEFLKYHKESKLIHKLAGRSIFCFGLSFPSKHERYSSSSLLSRLLVSRSETRTWATLIMSCTIEISVAFNACIVIPFALFSLTVTSNRYRISGINITQVLHEVMPRCEELLSACWWRNANRNCCEIFEVQKTEYGFCYSFNSEVSESSSSSQRSTETRPRRASGYGDWSGVKVTIHLGNVTKPPDSSKSSR